MYRNSSIFLFRGKTGIQCFPVFLKYNSGRTKNVLKLMLKETVVKPDFRHFFFSSEIHYVTEIQNKHIYSSCYPQIFNTPELCAGAPSY